MELKSCETIEKVRVDWSDLNVVVDEASSRCIALDLVSAANQMENRVRIIQINIERFCVTVVSLAFIAFCEPARRDSRKGSVVRRIRCCRFLKASLRLR